MEGSLILLYFEAFRERNGILLFEEIGYTKGKIGLLRTLWSGEKDGPGETQIHFFEIIDQLGN